ncbi:hypothetical protein LCGC14_1875700, partial [marine sediment metagenome]
TGNPHSITLTDLSTYDHKDLQNLQGGQANEYYHLKSAEHTEIVAWLDDVTLSDGGAVDLGTAIINAGAHNISDKKITVTTFTSTGINAAIDALGVEGGEVYLPEGTYTIDSTITFDYDNTVLRGAGFGTIIDASAAASSFNVINVNGKNNCQLRDLKIIGSAGSGNTQNLIDDGGAADYFIGFNLKLEDSDGIGIDFSTASSDFNLFYNVNVDNSDTHNIWLFGGGSYNKIILCSATNSGGAGDGIGVGNTGNLVENCYVADNTGRGIRGQIGTIVKGNTVLRNTLNGIVMSGSDSVCSGNFVSLNSGQGIEVIGARQVVTDNFCSSQGNNKVGILVNVASDSVVEGNLLVGAVGKQDWGIYLINSDRCLIQGNLTRAHDTAGINILSGSDNNHIEGNQLEGEAVAKITDAGSNNTVINATAGTNLYSAHLAFDDAKFLIFDKASGNGIKVDTTTPTFGWRDILGDVFARNTGATKPTFTTYRDTVLDYQFAADDEEYFKFHIPHDYVIGTDLHFHIHWSHTGSLVTGGTVTFEYEMSYAKGWNQAAFGASVSTTFNGTASTTQYQHIITEIQISAASPSASQIDSDDLEPDGVIILRLKVTSNDITVASGGVPDPFIHYADIHYQSTNIGTKKRDADFYA